MKRISTLLLFLPLFFLHASTALAQEPPDLFSKPQFAPSVFDQEQGERAPIEPGSFKLTRSEVDALILSRDKTVLSLPTLDKLTGNDEKPLRFRRVELMASGARVRTFSAEGESELAPRQRHFYVASNAWTGVGLAVDPEQGTVAGFLSHAGQKMKLGGNFAAEVSLAAVTPQEEGEASCSNESHDMTLGARPLQAPTLVTADSFSAAASGSSISYQAIVAIETDNEWMDQFNDDPDDAMDWILDMFLAMNVFFERDIETRLLVGDVFLRTQSDPYSVASGRGDQLDEFAEYWKDNMGGVDRDFAAMLSGRDINPGWFSGIAWLNQYCENGFDWANRVVGSYSYNAIGAGRSAAGTAMFVGHEIGHNMGSDHTHCFNPPVDHCFNGEGGCYSGTPACPSDTNDKGTIMSYCHVGGSSGAGCGSTADFHPTVQTLLESNLANQMAAQCIDGFQEEPDPEPEIETSPGEGGTIEFGDQDVSTESGSSHILVQNTGTADLSLSCGISGGQAGSFNLNACVSTVGAGGNTQVSVSCEPDQEGPNSATLSLFTNDADEPSLTWSMECNGTLPPPPEPEIDTTPSPGATLDFGTRETNTTSAPRTVTVENIGEANLNVTCSLVGSGQSHFSIASCPSGAAPDEEFDVQVQCTPTSEGLKQAQLQINSNDSDEGQLDFNLSCTGEAPDLDTIFSSDFEPG